MGTIIQQQGTKTFKTPLLYQAWRSDRASSMTWLPTGKTGVITQLQTLTRQIFAATTTTTKERVAQVIYQSIFYLDELLLGEHVFGSLDLEERNNLTDPAKNFLLFGTLNYRTELIT